MPRYAVWPRPVLTITAASALCLVAVLVRSEDAALQTESAAPRGGHCTFQLECDDGDPCTLDYCQIEPGEMVGSGTCQHVPLGDGQPGDCDDGLFCNGFETCDADGACIDGLDPTCCESGIVEYCTNTLGVCDTSSTNSGLRCSHDTECGSGNCLHCKPTCTTDADCSDGLACNGVEVCASPECVAGTEVCGADAVCSEKQCIGQLPAKACASNADCNASVECGTSSGPLCFRGRCCGGPVSAPVCSDRLLSQGASSCVSLGGNWFAVDGGFTSGIPGTCGGVSPFAPGVPLECPLYGSGIAQSNLAPPQHPVLAGPVSRSPQPVNAPNGPGTPFHRLGDDYSVSDGSHLALAAFRVAATMSHSGSVKFDFLDAAGTIVGDVTATLPAGSGVRVVYVDPPLVIPPQGFIAATVAGNSPNTKFSWHSAADTTLGTNDPDKLLVENDHNAANFMAPAAGILSFELLGPPVAAPLGACCASGGCSDSTQWTCQGQGGHFQGVGSSCPTSACDVGACCDPDTGDCDVVAELDCTGEFQGLGTDCAPDCCPQPSADTDCTDGTCFTGADNCAAAFVHSIPALSPGNPPHVVTITGDNNFATSTEAQPDSCFGPAESSDDNAGWFEAFNLAGSCTLVRIDTCCSDLRRSDMHAWLARDCNCENQTNPKRNPYDSLDATGHGPPICEDANAWSTFALLGPGDYFIPLPSSQLDPRGPYQVHIAAEACPTAACCLPDGSCAGPMHQLACDALGGSWLGPPQRSSIIADCSASPCATGSCCTGAAACEDEVGGVLMDKSTCDGLGGSYTGGIRCEGGSCAENPAYSCNDATDCLSAGGGVCTPGPGTGEILQPNPCPICPFEAVGQCNTFDPPHEPHGAISDLGFSFGYLAADDFIATSTDPIDSVCAWGFYLFRNPDPSSVDCSDLTLGDNFRVRVLGSGENGLPDTSNVVGVSRASASSAPIPGAMSGGLPLQHYGYHLTLDTPISGLLAGQKYWLEVANELQPDDECYWVWSRLSNSTSAGNDFSAVGNELVGYLPGGERAEDHAFCLPQPFDTPPAPQRPCCTCDGDCLDAPLDECNSLSGLWFADAVGEGGPLQCDTQFNCPGSHVHPAHDECAEAEVIPVGVTEFSTACATTDGVNPLQAEGETFDLNKDIWLEYHATQDCLLRIDMCNTGDAFDSAFVVYSNGTSSCSCPLTTGEHFDQLVVTSDDACATPEFDHGFVEIPAGEGQCFLIRAGGRNGESGQGVIELTCGLPYCGDDRVQPLNGEECDGGDDGACPGSCNPPGHVAECQCGGPCSCGSNTRCGAEECDGTDSLNCPGLCISAGNPGECTCTNICGNGVREGVEECDGPGDTSCGGEPGRCIPPGQPGECTCPARVCGNDFQDPGEECDGTDDSLCPGECRAPGDPAGECTCSCFICRGCFVPDPPQAEAPAILKPRFVSFYVPITISGTGHGLRVEMSSLHHPTNPPPGTPNFSVHEGHFRYVNSFSGTTICVDSATFNTDYRCAQLGCQPEYRDWASDLAGEALHVTGEAVVPSSTYNVAAIGLTCGPSPQADSCVFASVNLAVGTSRWGDVGGGGGTAPDGFANVIDIGLVVDNVKGISTAIPERRAWMKNPPNSLGNPVNVIDIGLTVDAVKGLLYPYSFPSCP